MRVVCLLWLASCATSGARPAESAAPAPAASAPRPRKEGEPEIVHVGKSYKLAHADALARYGRGASCGGADAPETQIGKPDQKNEMQVGRDRVVTYGFRFPEGTLMIRCRADYVEVAHTLK
jgi:hypothetical protein